MKIKFKNESFLWGGAISAEQSEGRGKTKKGKTIFDLQFQENPHDFWNNIGPEKTIQHAIYYKEDIKMWKDINLNSHRTSFSWARMFPEGDYNKPNMDAVNYYHDFIDELIKNNIKPIMNLFHFDMPAIEQAKGGWESREVINNFIKYCKFTMKEYSSKVKMWTVHNEPLLPVFNGYLKNNRHYPKLITPKKAVNVAYGIITSHAYVVNYFNEEIKNQFNSEIGGIFDSKVVYPKDDKNSEDIKAAKYLELYIFRGMTDAMIQGEWNKDLIKWLKELNLFPINYDKKDDIVMKRIKLDFIGLNYYSPARAKKPTSKNNKNIFLNYFDIYKMPNRRENSFRGIEVYPKAIFDTLMEFKRLYGANMKYMLTEFGMGVENETIFKEKNIIQDDYRIVFIKEHLYWLKKAEEEGVNIIGAHLWSVMDNWSWDNSFKNRYGLIEVDLKNQKRFYKKSALWIKKTIKDGYFEYNFDKDKMENYIDFDKLKFSESKL